MIIPIGHRNVFYFVQRTAFCRTNLRRADIAYCLRITESILMNEEYAVNRSLNQSEIFYSNMLRRNLSTSYY